MSWNKSRPDRVTPKGWHKLRRSILERDSHKCTVWTSDDRRCNRPAHAVDHIKPVSQGGTDHPANLASICEWHHGIKTGQEGAAAAAAKRAHSASKLKLTQETHPSQRRP